MSRREATARRAKAIALISGGQVRSQIDLVVGLRKAGFTVTQATASRDLEEVGAIRVRDTSGELIYAMPSGDSAGLAKSMPAPIDLILSVEPSGNLAIIKTPPGGAHLVASWLDNNDLSHVIGTIAGDDTVLVISKKAHGGAELAKELASYREGRDIKKSSAKQSSTKKGRR